MQLQKISQAWSDFCIVAAPGPSLTPEVAEACRGHRVVAVSDAYRLLPFAEVLYSCDARWWDHHGGCMEFAGEKWSSHATGVRCDDKIATAEKYGLNLIRGRDGDGFSDDPGAINYGSHSGYQAIQIAGHKVGWRGRIALVGFDQRVVDGKRHFFGDHPAEMNRPSPYNKWFAEMQRAADALPAWLEIVNCTPGSALPCFARMDLRDALPVGA